MPAMAPSEHITVLLHEAVEALVTTPEGLYVDATFGRGGHSRAILERLASPGCLVAIDRDPEAVQSAREAADLADDPRFSIEHASFANLPAVLAGARHRAGARRPARPRRLLAADRRPGARLLASASTARSTCGWIRPAARAPPSFLPAPTSATLRR